MNKTRVFTGVDGFINDKVLRLEFDLNEDGRVSGTRLIGHNGKAAPIAGSPWNLRDAESLVSTKHWREIIDRDVPTTPGAEDAW